MGDSGTENGTSSSLRSGMRIFKKFWRMKNWGNVIFLAFFIWYYISEDKVVWLWHLLINLHIKLTILSCYGSILLALALIGREGGLSTLYHSCQFALQQRVLKTFSGPCYLPLYKKPYFLSPNVLKRWSFQKHCTRIWSFLYYQEGRYFFSRKSDLLV